MRKYVGNNGFTLLELLVGMAIGMMVVLIVMTGLNYVLRAEQTTRTIEDLQHNSTIIFNDLVQEVRWTGSYTIDQDPLYPARDFDILTISDGVSTIEYRVDDDFVLLKNDNPLTLSNIKVNKFKITNISTGNSPMLHIEFNLEDIYGDPLFAEDQSISISLRNAEL